MTYHMTPLPTHMSCNWCQFISRLAVFRDPSRVDRTSNDGEWHFRLGKRSPCYSLHYKCFLFMRDTMKLTYITYASSIFSPAKIEWNGIQLLLSQRRVFLSFSFFLMRIWVLCKLCHNELSCTFHHVALCWRIKQMVNWFSGNCSKIKKLEITVFRLLSLIRLLKQNIIWNAILSQQFITLFLYLSK